MKKEKKGFKFKIGADPEFNIVIQDKRISAAALLPTLFKGYEEKGMGYQIRNCGELGWDGANATAEIRPTASSSPKKLTKNIGDLIKEFTKKTELFELSTLSNKASVGGHIHFEISEDLANNNVKMNSIHKKLCSYYIPLFMSEDSVNLRIRLKQGYGSITDHRTQIVNNPARNIQGEYLTKPIYTYEFRVPSAEWLTTPKIAQATLAYLATVFHEINENPKNFMKEKKVLLKSEKQGKAIQDLAITHFPFITTALTNKVKQHIKTFEYYDKYKEEIEYITSTAKVLRDKQKANYDILNGWKLKNNNQPTKKLLFNEKKIKAKAEKIDLDTLSEIITISYNNDINVVDFVKAIKNRILTLNWKLKNNYILFGLRKGIDGYIVKNYDDEFLYDDNQIKTQGDMEDIGLTFQNIKNKFTTYAAPRFSKDKSKNKTSIIIGIPYKTRINTKTKTIIEMIYDIEKGNIGVKKMKVTPETDKGKIWKLYNSMNETVNTNMVSENDYVDALTSEVEREVEREEDMEFVD